MIEEKLEKLRKQYLKTSAPDYLLENGWVELKVKISGYKSLDWRFLFGRGLVFVSIILSLLLGVTTVAQASKPGDVLYPLKLATDEIVAKVAGKPEYKVERRGQEVIDLSRKPNGQLQEATNEYQKALEETQKESQPDQRKQEALKQSLENQAQKLKDAAEKNPVAAEKLEVIIDKTEKAKEALEKKEQKKETSPDQKPSEPPGLQNKPEPAQNIGR